MTSTGIVTAASLAKVFGVRSAWEGAPGCWACSSMSIQRLVPSGLAPRYEGPTSRYTAACLRSSGISTRAATSLISLSANCTLPAGSAACWPAGASAAYPRGAKLKHPSAKPTIATSPGHLGQTLRILRSLRRHRGLSFDHLVGGSEQLARDGEAERLRGFEVEHQVEFRRLLDRDVGGVRARENACDVCRAEAVGGRSVCRGRA